MSSVRSKMSTSRWFSSSAWTMAVTSSMPPTRLTTPCSSAGSTTDLRSIQRGESSAWRIWMRRTCSWPGGRSTSAGSAFIPGSRTLRHPTASACSPTVPVISIHRSLTNVVPLTESSSKRPVVEEKASDWNTSDRVSNSRMRCRCSVTSRKLPMMPWISGSSRWFDRTDSSQTHPPELCGTQIWTHTISFGLSTTRRNASGWLGGARPGCPDPNPARRAPRRRSPATARPPGWHTGSHRTRRRRR